MPWLTIYYLYGREGRDRKRREVQLEGRSSRSKATKDQDIRINNENKSENFCVTCDEDELCARMMVGFTKSTLWRIVFTKK